MDYNTFIYLLERQENGNTQGNNEQRYLNAFYKDKGTAYAEASKSLLVESKSKVDGYISPVAKLEKLLDESMEKLGIILPKGMKKTGKGLVDEVKTCGASCAKRLEAEGSALPSDLEFISGIKEQELKDTKEEVAEKLNIPFEERACEFCSCTGDYLAGLSKEEFAGIEKELPEFADFIKRAYSQGFCKTKKESESCYYANLEQAINDILNGIIDQIT